MIEAEWFGCTEPRPMLEFLRAATSDRKLRLAACAFCRRVLPHLTDRVCWSAIEAAEQYADGALDKLAYLDIAWNFDRIRRARFTKTATAEDDAWNAVYCAVHRCWESEHDSYFAQERWQLLAAVARDAASFAGEGEAGVQAGILRDIVGNPFCPVGIRPAWLSWNGGVVVGLAQAAYRERQLSDGTMDPARLAVLADALEEAGATDPQLLDHLRAAPAHVRGCFALDLLLANR
jgi:hypothetical protein